MSEKIKKLKAGKASGLSPCLLKDSAEVIAKPLTRHIINTLLSHGAVPRDWRFAKLPLFLRRVWLYTWTSIDLFLCYLQCPSYLRLGSPSPTIPLPKQTQATESFPVWFQEKPLDWDCCYSFLGLCMERYASGSTYRGCLYWPTESIWLCWS